MKFVLRLALFAAIFTLPLAAPASAQYMYLDANGDGVNTAADQMNANLTPTIVDVYLDTNHNRGGAEAFCNVGPEPLNIVSWVTNLRAVNGKVTYTNFINQAPEFNIQLGLPVNADSLTYKNSLGHSLPADAPGLRRLFTITVTGQTGTPRIEIPDRVAFFTSFGTECPGNDFDNNYKLTGPSGGSDWTDVDGLSSIGGNAAPTLTVPLTSNGAEGTLLTINASATDPDVADILTITQTNNAPFLTFTHTPSVSPASASLAGTPNFDQAGVYAVDWSVTDGNGGTDVATTAINIAQTNRAPVLNAIGNRTVNVGAPLTFTATATDPDGGALLFSLDAGAPVGAIINDNTGVFTYTPLVAGTFPATIRVTDSGIPPLEDFETISIMVNAPVNQNPILGAIGNKTVAELATLTFTATATDPDGDNFTFSLDAGAPAGATINGTTGAFSWSPTEAQGPVVSPITVRVTDDGIPALNDFEAITVTVNEVNVAPVLGAIGNMGATVAVLLTFTATATDADLPANTLTFSLDTGAPAGSAIDSGTGVFTWTPASGQVGGNQMTIRVTDNGTPPLSDFEAITVNVVGAPNQAPVLGTIGDKTVAEGSILSFTATATDPDASQVFSFSLDAGAPAGATINATSGVFLWQPIETDGPGAFPITVRVTDNGSPTMSDSELITVTVTEVNLAPVLNLIGNRTVSELSALTFTATATDADLPPNTLTFSLDAGAPAGASIAAGGAFSWTPTEAQGPGSFPITVRVTDNGTPALDASELITVTVNEVNVAPVLGAIGDKTVAELAALTFTATATDADLPANALSFSLGAGAPAGATINASTGVFSWTPTEAQGPGSFPITLIVTDDGTPVLSDNEAITVTVNEVNVAPVLGAIGSKTVDELVELAFTATATDADLPANTLSFSLGGGAPAGAAINPSTGAFSWTPTEAQGSGAFPITVVVTDDGTPALSDNETITVTVNEVNVAPVLVGIGDKAGTVGVPVTFTATATDADIPANALAFSLDAGAPANATINATTGAFTWTPTANGSFPVTVRVTDDGTPALEDFETISIEVSAAPNQSPVLGAIGDKTVDEEALLSFTATATDPDAGQTLTFSLDAGAPAGAAITTGGAFSWTPTEAEGPGDFPITVRVTDDGTPPLSDSETITVTVNEVNVAPVLAAIGDKSGTVGIAVTFTATATDADIPANVLTFSLDAGAPAGATINAATGAFSFTSAVAGPFPVTVRVTDDGTPALSDFEAITINVNAAANEAPVLGAIGDKTVDEEALLSFTATATDPNSGDVHTFSLDAGAPAGAAIGGSTGAFSWTPTEAQGPGSYPITVRVTDNGSPPLDDFELITVTVNEVNVAPVLAAIGDKSGTINVPVTFTATATDADLPPNALAFSLDVGAPAGATIDPATGAFSFTSAVAGAFPVTVRVTDDGTPALSDFEAITINVNAAANEAPVLDPIGNSLDTDEETTLSFTATATDPNSGDVLTFSLDAGAPAGATIGGSTGAFSWTPTEAQGPGSYPITVRVTDNGSPALDDFELITVPVNEVNVAPVLAAIGDKSGAVGVPVTFTASATDADIPANVLAFSLDAGAPAGATIDPATGAFSFTPGAAGTFPVTVRVTDDGTPALNDFEAITITATEEDVNDPPVLAAIGDKTVDEQTLLAFTATATDPDAGQTLTFSLDAGAPSGAAITSGGAFSWTPTEIDGPDSYPVTVRVTDNGTPELSDFEAITITVDEVNLAPVLAAIGNKSGVVASAVTFTASATDNDIPTNEMTFSLDAGAPAGATIDPTTGEFSWTPPGAGSFQVVVRVTDNGIPTGEDFEEITITVTDTPADQPPTVSAPPSASTSVGSAVQFTVTATDPDGDTIATLTASPLLTGATFAPNATNTSGTFLWAPVAGQEGSHTITFTASNALSGSATTEIAIGPAGAATSGTVEWTPAQGDCGSTYTVTWTATDGEGLSSTATTTVTVVCSSQAPGLAASIALASGSLLAFNAAAAVALPPVIFAPASVQAALGEELAITAFATDPDGGPVTLMANISQLSGATFTTDAAPQVTAPVAVTGAEGTPLTINVTASDPDSDPIGSLTADLSGLPLGNNAVFTANGSNTAGTLNWTPSSTDAGVYNVPFTATNPPGLQSLSGSAATMITVNDADVNDPPVLAAIGDKTVDEQTLLAFTATATDPDAGQTLTFSLDAGAPAGAAITSGGAFSWTPTEAQGPGSYPVTVRVTDNGTPNLDDFEAITIIVNEANVAPVLAAVGNKSGTVGLPITFMATATDADIPANALTFSLDAGAPSGAAINGSTGAFSWTPGAAGAFPVTVRVTDNGVPALDDFEAITINVVEPSTNRTPVLNAIPNKTINEGSLLSFLAIATDPDAGQTKTFSLDAGAPAGAAISPAGAFTWTPSEAQGPGDYSITVRVTDNGAPPLSDAKTFQVKVKEVNVAPVLAPIGNKTVAEGQLLSFTATATDADLPPNTLTFSLGSGAPSGASIGSASGVFTWTPSLAGTFQVKIRVKDNGSPVKEDSETIRITVTSDVLPAHAFFHGINLVTIIGIKHGTCVQIEPVRDSYSNQDVDLNSIVMKFRGEQISANCDGAEIDGDKNRNGVREIQACFSSEDLRDLFSSLGRGFHQVEVIVEGSLDSGQRFRDAVKHYVLVLGLDCRLAASPNPINPETVLSFATTQAGPVKIQIFDVHGRLIRSLYDGTMPAGINTVRWDGSSRNGNRVATGVYFVRARTVDGEDNLRLTVLK